jgi:hypothetical protein
LYCVVSRSILCIFALNSLFYDLKILGSVVSH